MKYWIILSFSLIVTVFVTLHGPTLLAADNAKTTTSDTEKSAWEKTKDASEQAWDKTKEVSGKAWDKTKEVSDKTWEKTKEVSADAAKKSKELGNDAVKKTKEGSETAWEKTKDGSKKAWKKTKEAAKSTSYNMSRARFNRSMRTWTMMGNYSYIDLWAPGKKGMTIAYSPDASGSWEFEYMKGKVEIPFILESLGEFSDQRLSLFKRSYKQRNTFSYLYGLFYNRVDINLGPDLLGSVSEAVPNYNIMRVETMGVTWGIGNRWQFANGVAVGADWFVLNVPLVTITSEAPYIEATGDDDDREDAQDVLDFVRKFPTVVVLKFQIGGSF